MWHIRDYTQKLIDTVLCCHQLIWRFVLYRRPVVGLHHCMASLKSREQLPYRELNFQILGTQFVDFQMLGALTVWETICRFVSISSREVQTVWFYLRYTLYVGLYNSSVTCFEHSDDMQKSCLGSWGTEANRVFEFCAAFRSICINVSINNQILFLLYRQATQWLWVQSLSSSARLMTQPLKLPSHIWTHSFSRQVRINLGMLNSNIIKFGCNFAYIFFAFVIYTKDINLIFSV